MVRCTERRFRGLSRARPLRETIRKEGHVSQIPTPIDLRSDTVTRPDAEMRKAIARAEVGDDVFGEDPTMNRLLEQVSARLGKEAAIFVPSGTMGNQICVNVHTRPGDEALAHAQGHVLDLSLIHISEPTRLRRISYAVFCLKKKKTP